MEDAWWEGVRRWYNDHDFHGAMDVWTMAFGTMMESAEEPPIEVVVSSTSWRAPRLVFLAGCWMDAGDYRLADQLLRQALQESAGDDAYRAILELLACRRESGPSGEAWATWAYQRGLVPWNSPYQRPGYFTSRVRDSKAVYAREEQPRWCRDLEDFYPEVRDELQRLMQWTSVGSGERGSGMHDASVIESGDWNEIVLFGTMARPHLAPRACQWLQRHVPEACDLAEEGGGEVILSRLAPGTVVASHCASSNLRLTAHLGVQIPESGASLQVAGEQLEWNEGKVLVFDDSYEHSVRNDSHEPRVVLLIRFWHPSLPQSERTAALQDILKAKDLDQDLRFIPPCSSRGAALARLRSACPNCGEAGFETLRAADAPDVLHCSCSSTIA